MLSVLSFALLTGCRPEVTLDKIDPRIAMAPGAMDFDEVAVPLTATETVYLTNSANAELTWSAWIDGDPAFTLSEPEGTVDRRGAYEFQVTFAPVSFLTYDAELVVNSDDPENPELRMPLHGVGVDRPMPDIAIDPQTLEFDTVAAGATDLQFITLRNEGDAPLTLGSIQQQGSGAFVLRSDPSNNVVGANSEVPILIEYAPTSALGDSGRLSIPSDDPDEPQLEVVLLGNGGGDFEYPDAEIDCPGTSEPPIYVQLDGSDSTDPAGLLPLSYEWSIVSLPTGSQGDLSNLVTSTTELFTDVAGDYEVQLVVENAAGTRSAPQRCAIAAIPADDVHIELTWDTPAADLDLHLARGNAAIFGGSDDCSFCRPSPNWGSADESPRLDLDDQGGYGPENINIRAPANGTYKVRVHYFEEHQDDAVTATVKVFLNGTQSWSGSRVLFENEVWDVGVVNWPDATFGALSVDNYPSPARSCSN